MFVFCKIATYSKIYIFGHCLHFWHRAPKPWNFLCDESREGIFHYVNEMAFGPHLSRELFVRRTTHVTRG